MQLSHEIFNILKGANIKLKLFDPMGNKTLDPELSARFYAYDNDFLITIREEEVVVDLVVQAGASFNFNEHKDILNSIKKAGHNAMAEYNIRKFDKNIELKDFAHDVVKEDDRTEEIRRLKELSGITEGRPWNFGDDGKPQYRLPDGTYTKNEFPQAYQNKNPLVKPFNKIKDKVKTWVHNKTKDIVDVASLGTRKSIFPSMNEEASDVTHAELLPHIKNVKAAIVKHAEEDPKEAAEFIEHLDYMMTAGDIDVVSMMQPDGMDTEARDSLIYYFLVSISKDPTLFNVLFPGENIAEYSSEYSDMFESYSPGDEMEDGYVSNCCGANIANVDDGHGRCSECHEMASAEKEEDFYENTYDTKDFEVNPRAGHRDQMAHP